MNNLQEKFDTQFPNGFFLTLEAPKKLEVHLRTKGFLHAGEHVAELAKAGDGNMNLTLRVSTSLGRSFIVKQARPWVEKYPQIAAPAERGGVEGRFYRRVGAHPVLAAAMPQLLAVDFASSLLILSDLGEVVCLETLYQNPRTLPKQAWARLGAWLGELHRLPVIDTDRTAFHNMDMRMLNHHHIFELPLLANNQIPLDVYAQGLADAAQFLLKNEAYRSEVTALGQRYLSAPTPEDVLLHGDYCPGNWLKDSQDEIFAIDPEFCFVGPAEFDLSIVAAHLQICGAFDEAWPSFFGAYTGVRTANEALLFQFAGVEIMRRLLGVAQLPIAHSLAERVALLELSEQWVLSSHKTN